MENIVIAAMFVYVIRYVFERGIYLSIHHQHTYDHINMYDDDDDDDDPYFVNGDDDDDDPADFWKGRNN
jgi:hypothetical protein